VDSDPVCVLSFCNNLSSFWQHELALKYLRLAYEYENANLPATMDLTKTLMAHPVVNKEEFDKIALNALSRNNLSKNHRAQLYTIMGYQSFMIGDKEKAVQFWIDSYKTIPDPRMFSVSPESHIYVDCLKDTLRRTLLTSD
jgi:hypothetical protein